MAPVPERTDAERLKSAEITLATLREHVDRLLGIPAGNEHGRGYEAAMRDVRAILDSRWLPEGQPVVLSASS